MSVIKHEISGAATSSGGDITQVCSLLSMWASDVKMAGKLFKSVSLRGNTIYCSDWNDDIIFRMTQAGNDTPSDDAEPDGITWWYAGYTRYSENRVYAQIKNATTMRVRDVPVAIYFVGNTSICIRLSSGNGSEYMIVISEASDGSTCVLLPTLTATASSQVYSPPKSYSVTTRSNDGHNTVYINTLSMNYNNLTHVYTYGTYGDKVYVPNVFVYSSTYEGDGLYGGMYRIETESGKSYLTNGVFAILDKEE